MRKRSSQDSVSPVGRVLRLLLQKRLTTVLLLSLILVTSTLDITVPFLTQRLIDTIIRAVKLSADVPVATMLTSLMVIFLAVVTTRALRSLYNYRLFKTVAAIEDGLKNSAFENFLKLDTASHVRANSGQVIGSLDRGGTAIFVILCEIFGQNLIPPMIVFLGVFASLLAKNPLIACVVFVPLPIYLALVGRLAAPMHELELSVNRGFEAVSKECYDIASNVATVKKYAQESREGALQRRLLAQARIPQFRAERTWAGIENMQSLIATLARVTVIGLGGYLVLRHRCTVGEYVLYLALQDMLFGPMAQLSILLPKLRRNVARAEGLFAVLDQKPTLADAVDARALAPLRQSVEFRNVSFRYEGSDHWALQNVNFTVPVGATVALIGRSGTGKSTLVNLLMRCYDPQHGSILVDGVDIREATQATLRRQIAVVPQEVDLFSRTIAENVAYGCPEATAEQLKTATQLALADEFIERSEDGYATVVGERGLRLSGGERQRIGIARAILRDPQILVLDEATSHLDTESEYLIQNAMKRIAAGRTCFIIAHRLSTVRHADLVVVFGERGVEAVGSHEDLWNQSPTYRRLHELHLKKDENHQPDSGIQTPPEECMEVAA